MDLGTARKAVTVARSRAASTDAFTPGCHTPAQREKRIGYSGQGLINFGDFYRESRELYLRGGFSALFRPIKSRLVYGGVFELILKAVFNKTTYPQS